MNFPLPHVTWDGQKSRVKLSKGESNVVRKKNEDKFLQDFRILCPRIGIKPHQKSEGNEEASRVNLELLNPDEAKVLDITLDEHHTLPIPVFAPSQRKCGRGPVANNLFEPSQHQSTLLRRALRNECNLLKLNREETGATSEVIEKYWRHFMEEGRNFTGPFKSLESVIDKYAHDEQSSVSYAGGNLGTINLNNERYLVHSLTEWDCALCLSRMTLADIDHPPIDIRHKVPLDGGAIYQITAPRQTIERDSDLFMSNDQIFATRQLHTTRLWKATYDETHEAPGITKIQEYCDSANAVRFVQLDPDIWGEFCELRRGQLTLSRNGYLSFQREVNAKFDRCFYALHPKMIMMVSHDSVEVLDTRCRPTSSIHPAFCLKDKDFRPIYNISPTDIISCFSPSTRENISFMATGRHLFVWDVRLGKRPLSCTPHLMDSEPFWLSSVAVGPDKEWLFLDSICPKSSSAIGYSWTTQKHTVQSSETIPAVGIQIECTSRLSVMDTLDYLRSEAMGLDWAVKNRFEQQRCGVICDKDSNGTILIGQSNAAGDIYFQQLNINEKRGFRDQTRSRDFKSWMSEWIDAAVEFEETTTTSTSVEQSEHFFAGDIIQELKGGFEEVELGKWQRTRPDLSSPFTSPRTLGAGQLEQYCAEDFTKYADARGLEYNRVWGVAAEKEVDQSGGQIAEDSFAHYAKGKHVSSTPVFREEPPNEANIFKQWLSTPSQQLLRPYHRPNVTQPQFSSTPMQPTLTHASSSSQQSQKRPIVWDDF